MKDKHPRLKHRAIHQIITFLAPKRIIDMPSGGQKELSRGITKDALNIIAQDLNTRLELIVEACAEALKEVNENPNSTFIQKRYDEKVIKRAMKILRKRQFEGPA